MTAPQQEGGRRQFRTMEEFWAAYFPNQERTRPNDDLDPKEYGTRIAREAIEKAIHALENRS